MELEGTFATENGLLLPLGIGNRKIKDLGTGSQGAPESVFLRVRDLRDACPVVGHLGIRLGHQIATDRQQFRQYRLSDAKQAHGADHPAQQSAQHVAARLIARRHAVTDQHQARPDVIADHPKLDIGPVISAVRLPGELSGACHNRIGLVDLVEVGHAL